MSYHRKKNLSYFLFIVALIIFILLFVRICLIITKKDDQKKYNDPVISKVVVRGQIVDRNNKLLAIQTSRYNLYFDLDKLINLNEAALFISNYTDLTQNEILSLCKNSKGRVLIKGSLAQESAYNLERALNETPYKDSIYLTRYDGRSYPSSHHGANIIGHVSSENKGLSGVEKEYDEYLLPYPRLNEEITYGSDIMLTLDLDIQYLLDISISDNGFLSSMIIGAKDCEVYASSSNPPFDPNRYEKGDVNEDKNSSLYFDFSPYYDLFMPLYEKLDDKENSYEEFINKLFNLENNSINGIKLLDALTSLTHDGKKVKISNIKELSDRSGRLLYEKEIEQTTIFENIDNPLKLLEMDRIKISTIDIGIINRESTIVDDNRSIYTTAAFIPLDDPKYILYYSSGEESAATTLITKVVEGLINQGKLRSDGQNLI